MRNFLLVLILLGSLQSFGLPVSALPQQDQEKITSEVETAPSPLEFNEDKVSFYKEHPDFDYQERVEQDNWWTTFKRYVNLQYERFMHWLFGDYEASSILLFFIDLLPYLILIVVLTLAVWLFYRMNPSRSGLRIGIGGQVFTSEEEEIIQSKDISQLIEQAVLKGKFRLAVRYHFLLILQILTKQGIIDYEFSKTDEEYLKEIKDQELQRQFKELTRIYDFIWYGDFPTTVDHYKKIKPDFDKMLEFLNRK